MRTITHYQDSSGDASVFLSNCVIPKKAASVLSRAELQQVVQLMIYRFLTLFFFFLKLQTNSDLKVREHPER